MSSRAEALAGGGMLIWQYIAFFRLVVEAGQP